MQLDLGALLLKPINSNTQNCLGKILDVEL